MVFCESNSKKLKQTNTPLTQSGKLGEKTQKNPKKVTINNKKCWKLINFKINVNVNQ